MKNAQITLNDTTEKASIVAQSLHPETGRSIPRTKIDVERSGSSVRVHIHASDLSALRAALNSYLRWMKVSTDTQMEAEKR